MLPIAPSTYDEHARRRRDPERRPYRAKRDDRLRVEIKAEYEAKWYEAQHGQAKAA